MANVTVPFETKGERDRLSVTPENNRNYRENVEKKRSFYSQKMVIKASFFFEKGVFGRDRGLFLFSPNFMRQVAINHLNRGDCVSMLRYSKSVPTHQLYIVIE